MQAVDLAWLCGFMAGWLIGMAMMVMLYHLRKHDEHPGPP